MIDIPALVPELDVTDLSSSLQLYRDVFGFKLLAEREEEFFAYLAIGAAHLMLQQASGPGRRFQTASSELPFGRGINLQIVTPDVLECYERSIAAKLTIVVQLEERWYRQERVERGQRQFVVADPDGYLLRFYENLGARPGELHT